MKINASPRVERLEET